MLHPLQSSFWEKARQQMGIKTVRINNYLLTVHQIPYTSFKIGYLARSKSPDKNTLEKLYQYGKKNNLIFIKIEPYEKQSKSFKIEDLKFQIISSSHPLFPKWTQILNLEYKNEEELLKSFHPKTRYNIRLAHKKGVIVKEMSNDQGFEIFTKLYFATCSRQKYHGHNYQYHKIVWENLKNNIAHILIAFYQDEPLAAYQIWLYDDVAYYVYGGSSQKLRNFMGANLLMWEAIKFAKNKGAKKFDFWGSLPPNYDQSHPWAGFTRFKQGYGGEFVEMIGSFDLIINPFLYSLFNFIYKTRRFILKIF